MASDEWEPIPRGDMLYAGTGRTVLAEAVVAVVSVGGMIAVTALVAGLRRHGFSEPHWEWDVGLAAADRLGGSVLAQAWSILGLFATVLVAVALAGRGTFTMKDSRETAEKTASGLLRGSFDRRLSLLMAGRIGLFCGTYLAIAALLVVAHVVLGLVEQRGGGDAGDAFIVIPVMLGAVLLAAHIGVFVTDLRTRLSELENLRSVLEDRCDQIERRIEPLDAVSRRSSVLLIVWRTVTLVLLPGLVLVVSAWVQRPSAYVLTLDIVFLVITTGVAAVAVLTPWMTDVLEGWSEKAFRIWWLMVVVLVHGLWSLTLVPVIGGAGGWQSVPLGIAAGSYLIPVFTLWVLYRKARRPNTGMGAVSRAVSPFMAMDRVVLGDRLRQLERVKRQIADLEKHPGSNERTGAGEPFTASQAARTRPL